VTLEELASDPHPVLARLRSQAPVCWVPALGGWLVTGYSAAVEVLLDPVTFTGDDPRFTTSRVTGPSMLSLGGERHARHPGAIRPAGHAELRTAVVGPLAPAVMAEALGLGGVGVTPGIGWRRAN
jgi:cytochrome P450